MSEKIKNKTTIFAVFIAFVISFSTLYIFLEYQYNENYISKEETLFYSQFPNNEKNIFIYISSFDVFCFYIIF